MHHATLVLALSTLFAATSAEAQQPRAPQPDLPIDAAVRARVLSKAVDVLERSYVSAETARAMTAALRARERSGAYDRITSAEAFARALTDDLRAVGHDKHLRVRYSQAPVPPDREGFGPATPSAADLAFRRSVNYGFERAERLPGNIGYLELRGFDDAALAGPTLAAAFTFLAGTDALVIDLRRNPGGSGETVALVASYLFDAPTHLNSIAWRESGRTEESWTKADVPGRYGQAKPVYVLTSDRTFSAAEEFAYDLQTRRRAAVVGATTGGGAHAGGTRRLDDHFEMWVPAGRAVNPVTKTNWEGVGVAPDHEVPEGDALRAAQVLALQALLPSVTGPRAELMRGRLEELQRAAP